MKIIQGCKIELNSDDIAKIIQDSIELKLKELGCELSRIEQHASFPDIVVHGIKENQ